MNLWTNSTSSGTTGEVMDAHMRRINTSQGQHSFAGQRHGVPNREADAVNHPFSNQPVSHRRSIRPQAALDLDGFKNKVSTQLTAPLLPQKYYSDGIQETIRPSHRLPSGEQQMAIAIRAKERMLQEKLLKAEDKIRQRIQWESADKAAGNEKKRWEVASVGNTGWMRENKHRGRMHKEQDLPQKSLQKTAYTVPSENHRRAGGNQLRDSTPPSVSSPSHCSGPQQGELMLTESAQVGRQLLPCKVCNRKFVCERLEKHVQICEKVNKSHRQVFNSFINRTKGSELEEYLKTSSRSKSPEALKKKKGTQNHEGNISSLPQARLPAGTSQPKRSK